MPTIAELQINVNTKQINDAKGALDEFRNSADAAKNASTGFNQSGNSSKTREQTKDVKDLSSAIDTQTRKLQELTNQRKLLESSGMKSTMPQEYERLNRIIEANIALVNRQGNAVSQLSDAQDKDVKKQADQQARLESARQRAERSAIRQENVISNANAKQQREIEAVINSLSRQIKAQNDYNKAVEQLNKARAIGGMSGPGSGGISESEYDTYVKLAAAQRDSALAAQDNSRELDRARSKLDGYVGRLSAVERAQIEFGRATRTANDALQAGAITQQEYNQRMTQFAEHRDKTIAAANSNAQAEERLARQLKQVQGAYDPVVRATDSYNNAVKILSDGLQNGMISVDAFNKALRQQVQELDQVKAAANAPDNGIANRYNEALSAVLPYRKELENLKVQQRALDEAMANGHVVTQQQIKDHEAANKAIKDSTEFYNRRIAAANRNTISAKQEAAAMRGLPAQFTDIVVSLQGGMNPFTVLLQQGGQIKDMFGGVGQALKSMGTYMLTLITPVNVLAAALVAVGVAANSGSQETVDFARALLAGGNNAGIAASQMGKYQDQISSVAGTSGQAAQAMVAMASSGKIAGDQFVNIGIAAIKMQKATGQAIGDTINDFAALGKDPVDAAVRLDEKYKFLNSSILATADALVRQGKEQEAVRLLQDKMQESVQNFADLTIEQAGLVEYAWQGVKKAVSETWDFIKNIGRTSPLETQITNLQTKINNAREAGGWEDTIAIWQDQLDAKIKERDAAEATAAAERKANMERERGVAITNKNRNAYDSNLTTINAVTGAEAKLATAKRERLELEKIAANQGRQLSKDEITYADAAVKAAQASVDKAKEAAARAGKRTTPINSNQLTEVRSDLRKIEAEYDKYYKNVSAYGKAGVTSQEAMFASQKALLAAERKAVEDSYGKQIAEIKKLQGNKKNNASQNIQLNNQLTKAEEQRQVALDKLDAKEEARQAAETARQEKRIQGLKAYKAALQANLDSLDEQGGRDASAVGRGTRQAALNQSLYDNDRSYSKARRALTESLDSKDIDGAEYKERLDALTENHTAMSNKIIANDKRVQEAQRDWKNGFTSATENLADQANNIAGTIDTALSGAFNKAGDALATFVTTGKLNFKSFASSVISDMARIAAQQAASSALSGLFKIGATVASAYFGGGTGNGMAAGSAGYTSSNLGASSAGYSSQYINYNAKGGAFNQGKKYFAKGGAFTNSVVSSSTNFGMAGETGVMGEAGPEAIVPLARTADGNLGVRMLGAGDGMGGNNTIVNVVVNVSKDGSSASSSGDDENGNGKDLGNKIGALVRSEVYSIINTETRPGGTLQAQHQ